MPPCYWERSVKQRSNRVALEAYMRGRTVSSLLSLLLALLSLCIFMSSCGGGGSGGPAGNTGTVSIDITDAKPMLPAGTQNVWITFDQLLVHKSGGGWTSLPLAQTPYTIDLLQFHSGRTTELVPPTSLEAGKYTQVRMVVSRATIRIDEGMNVTDYEATVPSEKLRTDENFSFLVEGGGAVDITIDFDLSKSIVVTGPPTSPSYKIKPVLHLNETKEAATICGSLEPLGAGDEPQALTVTVIDDESEVYTEVAVTRDNETDPTEFCIYWLVPNENYIVQIGENGGDLLHEEPVSAADLGPGEIYHLNLDMDIAL